MKRFKWFRKLVGGKWFKYSMTGELPNCYGSWWQIGKRPIHRYCEIIADEKYKITWLTRFFCPHESTTFVRNIYGDEINHLGGSRSVHSCDFCGKIEYKPNLYEKAQS